MKRFVRKIKAKLVWFFDKRVLDAINSGASYEEVERLVDEIVG